MILIYAIFIHSETALISYLSLLAISSLYPVCPQPTDSIPFTPSPASKKKDKLSEQGHAYVLWQLVICNCGSRVRVKPALARC